MENDNGDRRMSRKCINISEVLYAEIQKDNLYGRSINSLLRELLDKAKKYDALTKGN